MSLERHEAKYMIHPRQVPAIREFIRPFCAPDENAPGEIPEYLVTTLQLDGPSLPLYKAREDQVLNRFKLRVRTYGTDGKCPIFLEIKRKIKGVIVKSRATVKSHLYNGEMCLNVNPTLQFKSAKEETNYITFVRLVNDLMARPVVRVRYTRESYLGRNDAYSRLTFDRKLMYQPASDWDVLPKKDRWFSMDSSIAQCWPYSGVILELKTFGDAPQWMVELTERFNLVRLGICKYYTAVRLESLFNGMTYADDGQTTGFL